MGGDERLEPGRLVGVDQGEGGLPFLIEDEDAGNAGLLRERLADDAQAVGLAQVQDVADGLVAEAQAAALLLGQSLRGDAGVLGSQVEPAARLFLELEIPLAGGLEPEQVLADPLVRLRPVEQDLEGRPPVLEEVGDVPVQESGDLDEGLEARRPLAGLEEGDLLRREPEGFGEGTLAEVDLLAGPFKSCPEKHVHGGAPLGGSGRITRG